MDNSSGSENVLSFDDGIVNLRAYIKSGAIHVREILKSHPYWAQESDGVADEAEMKANLTLAYRHLEDAAMRLGKVIQAKDGGKSVYEK